MKKKPKYKPIEREIALYKLANPATNRATIMRHFAKVYDTPVATVKRWYYNAMKIVEESQNKQQEAQDELLVAQAKEVVKRAIMSRNDLLEFYSREIEDYENIKSGKTKVKMIGNKVLMPTFKDAKEAGAEISKLLGYYAPEKKANTTVDGEDVENVIKVTLNL